MISFDVKSLFTNVPVDDLLSFLEAELLNFSLPLPVNNMLDLIKLCMLNSSFVFNDCFYKQKFGLAMGNPLSPMLANIYMEHFERDLIGSYIPNDVYWLRYVDDVICLYPDNFNVDLFLKNINNKVNSIKFTIELERNGILPFLDVFILRENLGFKYKIYRKPTTTNSFIHNYSSHPDHIKQSAFRAMFLRALQVVSPQFLIDEIKFIYKIGYQHKYNDIFLDRCYMLARKTLFNRALPLTNKLNLQNVMVLPYYKKISHLPELFKKLNIKLIFKYNNSLKNI